MHTLEARIARLEKALDTLMLELAAARDIMDVVVTTGALQQELNLLLPILEGRVS